MPKVEIKNRQVRIGRKSIPLLSGEVHYWRLHPNAWEAILASVRELGIRTVSTYVPWAYHETRRGHFDFTGETDPTRDLRRFLQRTRDQGFSVVVRPGPYIYSEWPNGGVPAYAYRYHRLHPKFLQFARVYLREVVRLLCPFLATRPKGHVILLQADNEIDPWPDVFGHQYGLNRKPGLFQEFLRNQYAGDIHLLNESWGSHYHAFEESGPYIASMLQGEKGLALKGDKELTRNLDYLKFKYDYSRRVAEWNVRTYRELGVDIPIYLNAYPFFYAHDWRDLQAASDFVGVDLYPSQELSEDAFEARKFTDKIRFLKSVSPVPFISEFESGVWHERHYESGVLPPNHYRLLALSALMAGAVGWNWYMLVNRDNWYMSPINEWGRPRQELYDVFKQIVSLFQDMNPPSLSKVSGVAATYNPLQYAARTLTRSTVLEALHASDVDYELWDPRKERSPKPVVFYSGNQWLESGSQRNLRRFVENGGTLIAFREYPRKDDRFRPYSIVGFEEPRSILFEFKRKFSLRLEPGRPKIELTSSVYCFDAAQSRKISVHFGSFGRETVGYVKTVGKGKIIHLGVEPTRGLVLELLRWLRVPLGTVSATPDVKTALYRRGRHFILIAVNHGEEGKSASVDLPELASVKGRMAVQDLLGGETQVCSPEKRSPFSFEIPRKDGRVFEFRPVRS